VTGLHRDRVIPKKTSAGENKKQSHSRHTYAILRKARWFFVVGIGLILVNSYYKSIITKAMYSGPLKAGCVPFLNCHACPFAVASCPIGTLQNFASLRQIPYLLMGYLGMIGVFFGRAACGWLCPFGWVQDMLYKIKTRKFQIPKSLTRLKYIFLVVFAIALPFFTGVHWFSRICPWGTIIAGIPWVLWNPVDPAFGWPVIEPGAVGWLYILKISVLVGFLALFVLTKRPFCRTTCPLGAIYALFNRRSLMQMRAEKQDNCARCGVCRDVCPVDIQIFDDPGSPECIRCLECTRCKHVDVKWGTWHG